MYKYKIILFLLTFSYFQSWAQQTTLQGKITGIDKKPIAGASVTIGEITTASNHEGDYKVDKLIPGDREIVVSVVGFQTLTDTILLSTGANVHNLTMISAKQTIHEVEVHGQQRGNRNAESLIKVENSIMPVTIIDKKTIALMGSRRLDEVVKEQTGIAIVNDVSGGSRSVGVQMQGFGSEYIMVLIDGQPMVGRNGGNFDLSRISVSNVERIEITKGAASLLYGGDALGGTINVITKHQIQTAQGYASVNYGTNQTVDVSLDGEAPILNKRGSLAVNMNYYHTDGFNTSQGEIKGTTAPPFDNYGAQARFRYKFDKKNLLSIMSRFGWRKSFMSKDFGVNYVLEDVLDEKDINSSVNFEHIFNDKWRSMTRYYLTRYDADMSINLTQGDSISQNNFGQTFHRLEQQFSYTLSNELDIISGIGGSIEKIDEHILSNENSIKSLFGYSQANWQVSSNFELIGGLRYDHIVDYGWRLDPSLGMKYNPLPRLTIKVAYGTAFKAPDMRKLHQAFYNPASNYFMIGSDILRNTINQMLEDGQMSQYELEPVYHEIKGRALNAEMSRSYNLNVIWETENKNIRTEGSLFFHDIKDQINPVLIGSEINNNLIYSYRNNTKAHYKGAELAIVYKPIPNLEISGGYQYLIAKDLTVGVEIREGGKFSDPLFDPSTGFVNYKPSSADYWGIENRSRHMFNARAFYTYQPFGISANIRVNYRGKYPFSDKNNNGYMDRFDTFVKDHYLLNAGLEKKLMDQRLSIRVTTENALNFVDQKVPAQSGRMFFLGVAYNIY